MNKLRLWQAWREVCGSGRALHDARTQQTQNKRQRGWLNQKSLEAFRTMRALDLKKLGRFLYKKLLLFS